MTKEEIENYNRLCAKFLGFKCSINEQYELPKMMIFPAKEKSNLCHIAKVCCIEDMQFHSDWNWIMEVVEAIEKKCGVSIVGGPFKKPTCVIHLYNLQAVSGQGSTKKEAVVQAINKFLIWYENNNKQTDNKRT